MNKEVRRNKKKHINLKKTRIKKYAQQGQRLRSLAPDVNQIEANYSRALKSVTHFMCQICYNRNKFGIGFSGIICARSYYLFDGLFYWRLSFHCSKRHCASFKFFSFYSLNRIIYGCFFFIVPAPNVFILLHWSHIQIFDCFDGWSSKKKYAGIISAKPKNEELSNIKQDIKSNGIQCVSVLALDP